MTMQKAIPRLFIALIIAATAIWLALNRDQLDVSRVEARIRDLGLLAPVAHVVLFAVGTVLFVPGALFGLAGGALFGPAWGTLVNLLGRHAWCNGGIPAWALRCADIVSGGGPAGSSTGSWQGWRPKVGGSSRSSAWCRSSRSTSQLRIGPDAHSARALCSCIARVHVAGHVRLHLARLCGSGSSHRKRCGLSIWPDRPWPACCRRLPAAAGSPFETRTMAWLTSEQLAERINDGNGTASSMFAERRNSRVRSATLKRREIFRSTLCPLISMI